MRIVNEDGEEHDRDIDRFTPTVEKQADDQQNQISPAQRRKKIDCQRQRQICKQKCQATENQSACPPFLSHIKTAAGTLRLFRLIKQTRR
jgi:hypothetical protein